MVQSIITRMAQNSFLLKGWTITLMAGIFAIAATSTTGSLVAIAFVPATGFWFLDAYYLRQERLFRLLYERVRDAPDVDFSMKTSPDRAAGTGWWAVVFSITLVIFYGLALLTVALVWIGISIAG